MKKLFFVGTVILTFFLGSAAFAGYIIMLKNGGSLSTRILWEEKQEVKFYWANGIIGIPKADILSIGTTKEDSGEENPGLKTTAPKMRKVGFEGALIKEKATSEPEAAKEKNEEKVDVEYYKEQKAFYLEEYQKAHERYLEAASRRDRDAKNRAWEEFNQYGGQVIILEEKLKKMNAGRLP